MMDAQHRGVSASTYVCSCGETMPRRGSWEFIKAHMQAKHPDQVDTFAMLEQMRKDVRSGVATVDFAINFMRERNPEWDAETEAEMRDFFQPER